MSLGVPWGSKAENVEKHMGFELFGSPATAFDVLPGGANVEKRMVFHCLGGLSILRVS